MSAIASPPARAISSRRVLLVDDDAQFRDVLKDYLIKRRDPSWILLTAGEYT